MQCSKCLEDCQDLFQTEFGRFCPTCVKDYHLAHKQAANQKRFKAVPFMLVKHPEVAPPVKGRETVVLRCAAKVEEPWPKHLLTDVIGDIRLEYDTLQDPVFGPWRRLLVEYVERNDPTFAVFGGLGFVLN